MGVKILFAAFLCLVPLKSAALELSLEENRGESGTIGYVDIDRVFKEYSGTLNAREEFLSEIRKKEETVNQRKAHIYTLKAEIAKLKQEREFALTLPGLLKTQEQMDKASKPEQPAVSTTTITGSTNTIPAEVPHGLAGMPGMGIDMPGINKVPVNYFKFSVSTAIPEIDAALGSKETELRQREDELKLYQRQIELELLEYESRKTELILGRIYLALKELAVKEEVSVIVDKRNILFGHNAVDLTDKLLKKLEEPQ